MAHFTLKDWEAFVKGSVESNKSKEMEEHLLTCNLCIDRYLSFFSEEKIKTFPIEPCPQFTSEIMGRINGPGSQWAKGEQKQRSILYYTLTACLTLFFTFTGVFDGFAGAILRIAKPGVTKNVSLWSNEQSLMEYGWSDKLMDNALTLIDTMKPKDGGILD